MQGCAALSELPELDGNEAKLGDHGGNAGAGIGVIARYEHDLLLPSTDGFVPSCAAGR